jgi:serine/threonine protein kinase
LAQVEDCSWLRAASESEIGAFLDQACAGDSKLREELESLLKQPRSTTIIGTSNEDAARGKILSPRQSSRELIPADTPLTRTGGESVAFFAVKSLPPSAIRFWGLWVVVWARYTVLMNHDQDVALKFLALGQTADDAMRSRFVSEVTMAREVTHPNVVRVHDIGQLADGEVFISMEFIDGEDLASLLQRAGRLSCEKTVQIARELCAGLGAAHDHGVLHRDLKPSNIVIDADGHVHIADFGIAAFVPTAGQIPWPGRRFHGPRIVSPQATSKQSDLYALGVVLYEVATGKTPFDGVPADGRPADRAMIPPSVLCPEIEPALERAILQCLEEDPNRRPESAKAIAALLPK